MPTYQVVKSFLGSFNQGSAQFGDTAGRQCACNSLFSIFWSKVRNIEYWTKFDLDKILVEGDNIYKSLNTQKYLSVDNLPNTIQLNAINTNINLLELHFPAIMNATSVTKE